MNNKTHFTFMALDQFQKLRTEDHILLKKILPLLLLLRKFKGFGGAIELGTIDKTKIYVYYESQYFRYIVCLSYTQLVCLLGLP